MILTTIDNIPLYSTLQEALSWASANGLTGYHTHMYQGTLGYMGGATQQWWRRLLNKNYEYIK